MYMYGLCIWSFMNGVAYTGPAPRAVPIQKNTIICNYMYILNAICGEEINVCIPLHLLLLNLCGGRIFFWYSSVHTCST